MPIPILIAVFVGAYWLYFSEQVRPSGGSVVSKEPAGWTLTRRVVEAQIIAVVSSRHLPITLAHALVANSYAESLMDPSAVGDGGQSYGIYQMYDKGLGKGYSVPQRQDVAFATGVMVDEARRQGITGEGTLASVTEQVARLVERPANIDSEVARRVAIAKELYPGVA